MEFVWRIKEAHYVHADRFLVCVHLINKLVVTLTDHCVNCFQLYSDFADHFGLSECKLSIIHCAGHHDPTLVESLWQDIVDTGGSSHTTTKPLLYDRHSP